MYIYIYLDLRSSVNLWLFACSYMFLANRAHFHITSGNCPNEHLLNFHCLSLIKGACLANLMEPRPLNNSVEILWAHYLLGNPITLHHPCSSVCADAAGNSFTRSACLPRHQGEALWLWEGVQDSILTLLRFLSYEWYQVIKKTHSEKLELHSAVDPDKICKPFGSS